MPDPRTAATRTADAVAVLAEMERHAPIPNPVGFYAIKLRAALGVTGPLACTCGGPSCFKAGEK